MELKCLIFEVSDSIATVTLNRPKVMNALSTELLTELDRVMDAVEADDSIKVMIVTGSEKALSAGADVSEVAKIKTPVEAMGYAKGVVTVIHRLGSFPKPTIAAVSGLALGGGCEVALACDIRLASETALFGLPEVKLGALPGAGGTVRLTRLVGTGKAKELLLLGDPIPAAEAHRLGIANQVVPADELLSAARGMAKKIAANPGVAVRVISKLVDDGDNVDLASAIALEQQSFYFLFSTQDQKEGMSAFVEKRKPVFVDR